VGDRPAVIPTITGRGWITGFAQYVLAPDDPFPTGYTLTDIWPTAEGTAEGGLPGGTAPGGPNA
jgi:proline racemase